MAAKKGTKPPAAGRGRKRGTPNKTTSAARKMFTDFLEANVDRVQDLFDRVAKKEPARALELLTKVAEFVIPKLQRTELKGEFDVDMPEPPTFGISFANGGPGNPAPAQAHIEETDEFARLKEPANGST
jgi:hypothetical protein